MHIGAAYKALDSLSLATYAYNKALDIISRSEDKSLYQEDAIRLLSDYSEMKQMDKARKCKMYVVEEQSGDLAVLKDMAYGYYYEGCEINDSATFYFICVHCLP